jgi:uncharacterized protein YneF (UPF0154 family)
MKISQLHWGLILLLLVAGVFIGNVATDKYMENKAGDQPS